MIQVLQLVAGNLFGGAERMVLSFLEREPSLPIHSHFGVFFEGRFSEELRTRSLQAHPLGGVRWSRPWTVFQSRRLISQLISQTRVDAVICHGGWVHTIAAPVIKKKKVLDILWQHDVADETHWIQKLGSFFTPDLIIANSEFTKQSITPLFPLAQTAVVYAPIASDEPAQNSRAAIRKKLGAEENDVVILMAARFQKMKGQGVLIEALSDLAKVPGWKCWIASEPQTETETAFVQSLKEKINAFGLGQRVSFVGHHRQMPTLYQGADIYCQPNLTPESFGLTFAEAMLAELPLVTTKIGGAAELASDGCALWSDANSPESVSTALKQLIENQTLRQRLGQNGKQRAQKLCDPQTQAAQFSEVLHKMIPKAAAQ